MTTTAAPAAGEVSRPNRATGTKDSIQCNTGIVYVLEFSQPLGNENHRARYYVGYCKADQLIRRIWKHQSGRGAAITKAAYKAGITMRVVMLFHGDRTFERRVKNHKGTRRLLDALHRGKGPQWARIAAYRFWL